MAKGVDPKTSVPVYLEEDLGLPEAERSVFHLRPLPADVQARIDDESTDMTMVTAPARPKSRKARAEEANKPDDAKPADEAMKQRVTYRHGHNVVETLLEAITDIERYAFGANDTPLVWPGVEAPRAKRLDALSHVGPKHRQELFIKARAMNEVTEEDLGESA